MSNFFNDLPAGYALLHVIFVCHFAKDFVLPFQRLVLFVI